MYCTHSVMYTCTLCLCVLAAMKYFNRQSDVSLVYILDIDVHVHVCFCMTHCLFLSRGTARHYNGSLSFWEKQLTIATIERNANINLIVISLT